MSNRWLIEYRRQMVSQARGRVLKIGIGSGLNLPFYGRQVASVFGIDPSAALLRRAGRHPAVRAELVKAAAEIIPFDHKVFDTVVTTWTLCTIPQVISALCENAARPAPGRPSVVRGAWACAGPRDRIPVLLCRSFLQLQQVSNCLVAACYRICYRF
jgi:hypothetical protein